MTWLGIVWFCLGIFALAAFVLTVVWLFFKGRSLYHALSAVEFPESTETAAVETSAGLPGAAGNPDTLSAARLTRQEIKLQRQHNKKRRLQRAQERWGSYGLVDLSR